MFLLFLLGAVSVLWYVYHFEESRWIFGAFFHILMGICIVVNYLEHEFKDSLYLIGLWGVLTLAHWAITKEARSD